MLDILKTPLHRSLLILLAATLAAFWMRNDGMVGLSIGATTLAIAWFKGRLVVLDFMELRHAPTAWRLLIEGWLLLVTGLIFVFYFIGQSAA